MRAVIVEVAFILGQDCAQMPFTVDQQVVEALTACVPTDRSANAFARGDRTGVLMIRTPVAAKTSWNDRENVPSRSRMRKLNMLARSPRSINKLRAC